MYRRINNRCYNTETAKAVAHFETAGPRDYEFWYEEDLHRKPNGEFFLHGHGNADSMYADPAPYGDTKEGERIVPLGLNEAVDWAERHLDGAQVDALFGPVDEDSPVESIILDAATLAQLDYVTRDDDGARGARLERLIHRAYAQLEEREQRKADEQAWERAERGY